MNIDTGELRKFENIKEAIKEGFKPIPEDLKEYADKLLGNKKSVKVHGNHSLRKEMNKRFGKKSLKLRKNRMKK